MSLRLLSALMGISIFLSCTPSEVELLQRSRSLMDENKFEEAIPYLERTVQTYPISFDAWNMLGVAQFEMQNYQNAIVSFNQATDIDDSKYKPFYNRGNAKLTLEDTEGALADYNRAIEIQPNIADLYLNRAASYFLLDKWEEAMADYDFAEKIDPKNHLVMVNKGKIYLLINQIDRSEEYLRNSLQISENPEAYFWLGRVFLIRDMNEEACAAFRKAKNGGFTLANNFLQEYCND
jgi:tetratricopeptide (TPR) repeat protein